MAKYVAHNIMRIKYLGEVDPSLPQVPVWENLIFIEAASVSEAYEAAEEIGKRAEDKSENCLCEGQPAELLFCGTRKLVTVVEDVLDSGTELTYLQLVLKSDAELELLMKRKEVYPLYDDDVPDA